jgi:hypothetical protein
MNQSSQDKTTNDVAEEYNGEKPACLLIEPVSLKRGITCSNRVNHVYCRSDSAPLMRRRKADR